MPPLVELHVQLALLLAKAVEEAEPSAFLKANIELANLAEYSVHEGGPVVALVAATAEDAPLANGKAGPPAASEPTVFVAFSNCLHPPGAQDAPAAVLYDVFLSNTRPSELPGADACQVEGNALQALQALPMATVLSLLGQGYRLVCTGHKFGGMLAHLFATKVLLQLRSEMEMAQQMGISVPDMFTNCKVSSYAFGCPYFACDLLRRKLAEYGELASNLHTIWRAGDASPAFFTACGELYIATAPDEGALQEGDGAPPLTTASAIPQARSPQMDALQAWCKHVVDGVRDLPRAKAAGRLMAAPLDMALLLRACSPRGLLGPPLEAPPALEKGLAKLAVAVDAAAGQELHSPSRGRRGSAVGLPAAGPASPSAVPASPSRTRTRRASQLNGNGAQGPDVVQRMGSTSSSGPRAWRDSLIALLQLLGDAAPARYCPVGTFWILEGTVPAPAPAAAAGAGGAAAAGAEAAEAPEHLHQPQATLQISDDSSDEPSADDEAVDHVKAVKCASDWLAPGASQMFACWETGLDEYQKLLMEAFPWVSFRPTMTVGGAITDRKLLVQPSRSLVLV